MYIRIVDGNRNTYFDKAATPIPVPIKLKVKAYLFFRKENIVISIKVRTSQ